MATVNPTWVSNSNTTATVKWLTFTQADTGAAVDLSQYPDRTVQVVGTFGGGTFIIEGSNDGGTTYTLMHDPQGNDLSFTAAGIKLIAENPQLLRPRATAGAGSSVTIGIQGVANI